MAINKVVNKSTKSHGAMRNVIEYVLQDQKVREGYVAITGPYAHKDINWDMVYNAFLDEKRLWNKDSGRMYAHNIISFHKDEVVTPEQCLEIGQEFVDKFFPEHQCLITVHQDKEHLHIHIVTNSVSFIDGKKLHQTKNDLELQKEFTNNLCLKRGLSVTKKGKHFDGTEIEEGQVTAWNKDKYNLFTHADKKSFVWECAIAVMESKEGCCSKKDFIKRMEERGWSVTWTDNKKHITFQNKGGNRVRDSNLSKTFSIDISKEALLNEFARENELRNIENEQLDRYYAEVESAIEDTDAFIRDIEVERSNQSTVERQSAKERDDKILKRADRDAKRVRQSIETERRVMAEKQRVRKARAERKDRDDSEDRCR